MANNSKEGTLCWVEIPATGDIDELKSFYTSLFPAWGFSGERAGIKMYETPGGQHGGIVKMPEGCKPDAQAMGRGITPYYSVKNLEETEKRVIELGGKTCLEKQKEGENGHFMNFMDPQGNRFGTYQFGG